MAVGRKPPMARRCRPGAGPLPLHVRSGSSNSPGLTQAHTHTQAQAQPCSSAISDILCNSFQLDLPTHQKALAYRYAVPHLPSAASVLAGLEAGQGQGQGQQHEVGMLAVPTPGPSAATGPQRSVLPLLEGVGDVAAAGGSPLQCCAQPLLTLQQHAQVRVGLGWGM